MIINNRIKNITLLLTSLLLAACANQLPPGGGAVDTTPPEIIEVYPPNETANFNEKYFEITFSEYVDKRSVQDAIFISPAIEGEIEYSWSGKSLRVYFPENLREKTTYVVTIGTDAADYNNKNRMAEAFIITFSTGDEIDKRIVTGKVYDQKAEDAMIFAYLLTDTTTNPLAYKPDYISQAGKNGNYKLMGLASGEYRIFAVQDEFRDLIYQSEQDRIGIPFTDIFLAPDDTLYSGLDFFLTSFDTTSPRLISAIMTDEYHVLINISEEFDSSIIRADNFSFIDSVTGNKSNPRYAFKGNTKATEFVLVISEKFPDSDQLYIIADTLRDRAGNFYTNDFTSITLSYAPDTTKPGIFKTIPAAGTSSADYLNQEFYFFFNDAFNNLTAETGISFKDTLGKTIMYNLFFIDDASFKIIVDQRLEPQKDYIIEIDLSKFEDAAGNSFDSVYQYKFKTISGLDFTGVSGTVSNVDLSKNPLLVLEGTEREKKIYKQSLLKNNFSFERVAAGKYSFWCFYDIDSSGTYSSGITNPFHHSEEFFFYPDTLELKPRWTQTDVKFELRKRK